METGYLPIEKIIFKKNIMQKLHIEEKPEDKLVRSATNGGIWKDHIDQIMDKYQIQNQTKKKEAKEIIDRENSKTKPNNSKTKPNNKGEIQPRNDQNTSTH